MQNVFGSKFKQNPNTGNTTQTKSQYWKHNSNKITISGTKLKQNHNIQNTAQAKSQYLEQNQNKITMFGTQLKLNYNIWNTTQSQMQYLEYNTHNITILLARVKGKPLKIAHLMVKLNHDISSKSQTTNNFSIFITNQKQNHNM